jgi:hypothetical protein
MRERIRFHVVFVGKGCGRGVEPTTRPDVTIEYVGDALRVSCRRGGDRK